jgi:hypothetical protein
MALATSTRQRIHPKAGKTITPRKWIYQFWECLLRIALRLERDNPRWMKSPQMMRMTVTTSNVLKRFHMWEAFRPYNFFLLPILPKGGCPAGIDPKHFTLVAPFESDQRKWLRLPCINIADPNDRKVHKLSTSFTSREYGKGAVLEILEDLRYRYPLHLHPEAKSLGFDGRPSESTTRGLLKRARSIAANHRRIGKESDRRWEEGAELESLSYVPIEFEPPGSEHKTDDYLANAITDRRPNYAAAQAKMKAGVLAMSYARAD